MSKNEKLPENIKLEMIGEKRYVRINEGARGYSVSPHTFRMMTVLSKNQEISIAGDVYLKNLVKSKFLKLNYSHVEYVINCLGKNTTKVRNIKSYLLASLFNAGSTISIYYKAEVNHDMPKFAG